VAVGEPTAGGYRGVGLMFLAEYAIMLKILFSCGRGHLVVANLMKAAMVGRNGFREHEGWTGSLNYSFGEFGDMFRSMRNDFQQALLR
jgi:hypothetical protein